ncbi:hypothetical protein ACJX0J_012667, partial [Zea mays]
MAPLFVVVLTRQIFVSHSPSIKIILFISLEDELSIEENDKISLSKLIDAYLEYVIASLVLLRTPKKLLVVTVDEYIEKKRKRNYKSLINVLQWTRYIFLRNIERLINSLLCISEFDGTEGVKYIQQYDILDYLKH